MEDADPEPVQVVIHRRQVINIQVEVRPAAPISVPTAQPLHGRTSRQNRAHVSPTRPGAQ